MAEFQARSQRSTITLVLYEYNHKTPLVSKLNKCLSPNPPVQWLPSFAVVQVRPNLLLVEDSEELDGTSEHQQT